MKKLIVRVLAIIGGIVVLTFAAGIGLSLLYRQSGATIPNKTILEIDFERTLAEHRAEEVFTQVFREKPLVVRDVVEALQQAADDERVVAMIARIGGRGMGLAQIQELRDAILAFREKGKSATAYSESFGEAGPGNGAYYLATAFDSIYLQPSGSVGLTGLIYETPFLRGTLEKLGIVPRFDHRKEYKNAVNILTERKYTAPHKEAVQKVMESQFGQIVRGVATARGLSEDVVRLLANQGPFLGQQAVKAKLVDGLAYRDEVYAQVKEKAGKDAQTLALSKYLQRAGRPYEEGGETIALIYGVGEIHRGKSGGDSWSDESTMGSDTVAAAFRAAIEDKAVKSILFRVDSPGGSYVASDTIWRETVRAKEAGKPVIVSMGNVAGSGGYFVALSAGKIVAQPGTITGSIGVLAGKMLTNGFWDKIGLSWDEVHTSDNATMWTSTHDYTPQQWKQFQGTLDTIYEDFTSKVAQGRGLTKEKVESVAKGRIWTGEDAKALGLVDELGGFPVALRLAREAAGIPTDAKVQLKPFPAEKKFLQTVLTMLLDEEDNDEETEGTRISHRTLRMIRSAVHLARRLGLDEQPGVLSMPELELMR
jgi:protease-4